MAFRLQDKSGTARTLHAGRPTGAMLADGQYDVLDVLCNPWGADGVDADELAAADARIEAKLADPKANGWKRVDPLPAKFAQ